MLIGKFGAVQHDQLYRFNIRDLSRDIYTSKVEVLMYCIERNFIKSWKSFRKKILI